MQISLIRHGQSLIKPPALMNYNEFIHWQKQYDQVSIHPPVNTPYLTKKVINSADLIFTSHYPRSIDSAKYLQPNGKIISEPLFREADIPLYPTLNTKRIHSFINWNIIIRSLWIMGYHDKVESLSDVFLRAHQAAVKLINETEEHPHVAVVGHGIFNLLLGNALEALGCIKSGETTNDYWEGISYFYH